MKSTKGIMIVGVGGQGSLLASRILGSVLLGQGFDVKMSEVHGMSQRGGSVVTYVRCGDKIYSPIIEKGEADIILSFELLEAARSRPLTPAERKEMDPREAAKVDAAIAQVASTPAVAPLSGDESGIEAEGAILGLLGAAAVVAAIVIAADSDDADLPVSG